MKGTAKFAGIKRTRRDTLLGENQAAAVRMRDFILRELADYKRRVAEIRAIERVLPQLDARKQKAAGKSEEKAAALETKREKEHADKKRKLKEKEDALEERNKARKLNDGSTSRVADDEAEEVL